MMAGGAAKLEFLISAPGLYDLPVSGKTCCRVLSTDTLMADGRVTTVGVHSTVQILEELM